MSIHSADTNKSPGLTSGTMLVIATVVGGGMFSLPIAMAGVWFSGAAVILILVAIMMLLTGLMLVEVNLHFEPGASFNTFTTELLGKKWNIVVGIAFGFVLYILTYAYISGSSAVLAQTILKYTGVALPIKAAVVIVACLVAAIVWYSSLWVGRITTILIFGKFIAFFATFSGLVAHVEIANLLDSASVAIPGTKYLPYVLMTLPFCIISFGFHGNVPSLVKLYGKPKFRFITRSIIIGTIFAVLLYIFWLGVTMGNISRANFSPIIAKGGNIDVFVEAIGGVMSGKTMDVILTFFGNFAVASSLLAATLGLFDYIADLLNFKNDSAGRFKTAVVTYLPPAVVCFFFPNGFVYAIGYAGLAFTIWSVILPPFLVKASRKRYSDGDTIYRSPCNNAVLNLVIVCGAIVYLTVILDVFGWLPTFK
ncbi:MULTISPECIES: aromatic amino acid transporter [Morganella]|jgi:aromatic amino acid transport protein|uniref:Aromatic amino acid permease n=1 Tax=Morganella morganii TaxID=582 RepID=A0AAN5MLB2_MORMO|nr:MULTISPECIES: aromatic amino acid transporter [Morganella]MCU6212877.1 aromatic amino acid transporter [Morganella morganii]MCU6223856.1 aromatic amino acid transporter [Morganella morganii]MCU6234236.1 aromatic amino acid transporter [Morganella morganii]MCU6239029.1 aromatic amino acid transporter [Morganella morganii]MCU6273544.1 aromatic amino acid transporter [Morganella morganii]